MRRVLQLALSMVLVAAVRFPASPFDKDWLNRKSKPREEWHDRTNVGSPVVFQDPISRPYNYDDEVATTWVVGVAERDLNVLSEEYYTRLVHPAFPHHSVRIRRTKNFCERNARSYSGYVDIGTKHLYFNFFESRSSPDTDPVIMWTNGGPGCSSSLGLYMELGPCQIVGPDLKPEYNPFSWNSKASIFFIDQPVGVGFSYADYGEHVGTTEDAALDIAAFVAVFFQAFDKFKGHEFHLAGESYGGRYLPVFASALADQNTWLVSQGLEPVNLKSVMIGNGFTDFPTMTASYYDMTCTGASIPPFLPISTCVRMRLANELTDHMQLPRCLSMLHKECVEHFDEISCGAANEMCEKEIEAPFWQSGLNPYDISQNCDGGMETLCYPVTKNIASFLDLPDVRKTLGIASHIGNFSSCSSDIGMDFGKHLDHLQLTKYYVEGLLERGIRVLVYVGTYDWICNHVGNLRWTEALKWTGHEAYNQQPLRDWFVTLKNGTVEVAGKTRSANGLTFATVHAAGHMVPYDKPEQALAMVNRWLQGDEL